MEDDLINQFVLWKPIKYVSALIYILILLLLPINTFWSVIMLFGLIAFWSRIPCMISAFTKDLEVVDFFTVLIAIHVGGLFGGLFGLTIMFFSRIFGPREWFLYTLKDALSIFVGGLLSPWLYALWGNNALYTIYTFTVIRYVMYLLLTLILEPEVIGMEIGISISSIFVAYISNTLVMKFFEKTLSKVFENGTQFSLELFIFSTAIVGFFYGVSRFARWLEARKQTPEEHKKDLSYQPGEGIGVYRYYYNQIPNSLN